MKYAFVFDLENVKVPMNHNNDSREVSVGKVAIKVDCDMDPTEYRRLFDFITDIIKRIK